MKLQLLPCTENHLDMLLEISKETYRDAFEAANDPKDFKAYMESTFTKERLGKSLKNPETFFFLVYAATDLVAYIKVNEGRAQSDIKSPDSLELERIYIRKEHQGRKIGKWLLEEVKKLTIERKKTYLWLGVWEQNTRAISFYERNGFSKFGTHPYFMGNDEQTDWLMRFDIPEDN